ncbi:Sodium/hydrogen exchanger family-domain-containing protein [Obelidium mucronatum]|nr:Sodium/hydrogen exchanger family-domain-containing protein [Obelidium mucronatum]
MAWNDLIPHEPEIVGPHLMYLALGGFITMFGLVSLIIKDKLYMSEAMVAIIFGVLIGPIVGKALDPAHMFGDSVNHVTLEFTRIVVAIQCMACGVDLPGNYLWKEWKSLTMLLGPVMIVKWFITALGIYWIMGLTFLDCLIISACVTPTDPVLANSIVKGKFAEKHVPLNVRLILSAESGANDGLGTPFLLLAIYLQRLPVGQAIGEWSWKVVLYQVVLSVVIGIVAAYFGKRLLKTAERREWIDKESILSFSIALALFLMGFVSLIGSDDILAVFIAGNVLTWDLWFNRKVAASHFQEVIDALLNLAYFIYIGAIVPWSSFVSGQDGLDLWRLFLLALWVIVLRRVPVVMGLYPFIPALKDTREAFFAGWFGPIGAGAIFYAHIAVIYFGYPATPILPIIFFIVLTSVVVHGGSVALFNLSLNRTTTYTQWAAARRSFRTPQYQPERGNGANADNDDSLVIIGDTVINREKPANLGATASNDTLEDGAGGDSVPMKAMDGADGAVRAPTPAKKEVAFLVSENGTAEIEAVIRKSIQIPDATVEAPASVEK